jgi:AhpD family alkylhydroperoxidase
MRLGPLPEDQWDERARAALAALLPPDRRNPRGAGNAMATLARHPELTETFLPFSTRLLLRSTLPPRLRELAILRVARRCGCAYEWVHHVKIAARAGLSEAEVEAAGRGEVAGRGKAAGELDRAEFDRAEFDQAEFDQAEFDQAEFDQAEFDRAELDRAVLTAVDELAGDCDLSDRTWATLSEHLDERQLMDLVFTIGAYCLLAMAFNTLGVEPEQER